MNKNNKRNITYSEEKKLKTFKKLLTTYSDSRGAPDHLKNIVSQVCTRIDDFLKSENSRKRFTTLSSLIEIINKIISILKMIL